MSRFWSGIGGETAECGLIITVKASSGTWIEAGSHTAADEGVEIDEAGGICDVV